jgi:hypothetical protein
LRWRRSWHHTWWSSTIYRYQYSLKIWRHNVSACIHYKWTPHQIQVLSVCSTRVDHEDNHAHMKLKLEESIAAGRSRPTLEERASAKTPRNQLISGRARGSEKGLWNPTAE